MLPKEFGGLCKLARSALRTALVNPVTCRRRRSTHLEGLWHEQRARRRRFAHATANCGASPAHRVRDCREGELHM